MNSSQSSAHSSLSHSSFFQSNLTNTVKSFVNHHRQADALSLPDHGRQGTIQPALATVPPPINEFCLADLGINQQNLIDAIAPTFNRLKLDIYEKRRQEVEFLKHRFPEHVVRLDKFVIDYLCSKASLTVLGDVISLLSPAEAFELNRVGSVRHRAIAKFAVTFNNSNTVMPSQSSITRVPAQGYVQYTGTKADLRSMPRYFEEASDEVTANTEICQILRFVASTVRKQHPTPFTKLAITLHQVDVTVDSDTPFHLPDGLHQDGADYIISALPIIMTGVVPPLSTVYDAQLRPLLETRLAVGQGLLHDDRHYWHGVSALLALGAAGRRATLGLDVQVVCE